MPDDPTKLTYLPRAPRIIKMELKIIENKGRQQHSSEDEISSEKEGPKGA